MVAKTTLGYVLLGLLRATPRSGYDLRKVFLTTPMGRFSDSPGSIYPALRALQQHGLLKIAREYGENPRGRQRFALTPKGRDVLYRWITQPIDRETIVRTTGEVVLRFSLSESVASVDELVVMLQQFERHLAAYIAELRQVHAEMDPSHLRGRLAMDLGVRTHETQLMWCRDVLLALERVA
jgi:DNA-binding PadR family transcriptional regulator